MVNILFSSLNLVKLIPENNSLWTKTEKENKEAESLTFRHPPGQLHHTLLELHAPWVPKSLPDIRWRSTTHLHLDEEAWFCRSRKLTQGFQTGGHGGTTVYTAIAEGRCFCGDKERRQDYEDGCEPLRPSGSKA